MQLFQRYPGRTAAAALLAVAVFAAACTDRASNPAGPRDPDPTAPGEPGTPVNIQTLKCSASVPQKTVTCGGLQVDGGGASADVIIPGPNNTFVRLVSTNVDYVGATSAFTFDVTVRNLIDQPIGTTNGVALDPNGVRVFFLGPGVVTTGGTGTVTVNGDGVGTFTHANEPYYQYNTVLDPLEVSAPKTWNFTVPSTVASFTFELAVSTAVQYPNGYVEITGNTNVRSGSFRQLTAQLKDYLGRDTTGTVTWATADPLLATINPTGLLKGLRAGTVGVTAAGVIAGGGAVPSRPYTETVAPIRRLWTGSTSTDWFTGSNWLPDSIVPVATDTAVVVDSVGITQFPVLTANATIGGVEVTDLDVGPNPVINLAAFNLTASGDVFTRPVLTGSSSITSTAGQLVLAGIARTVEGRIPRTNVTGTYSLTGNTTVAQRIQSQSGRLTSTGFRLQQNP